MAEDNYITSFTSKTVVLKPGTDYVVDLSNDHGPAASISFTTTGAPSTAEPTTRSVIKSADESVASSTTLQYDDDLTIGVSANKSYSFECVLFVSGDATADIKIGFTCPANSVLNWLSVERDAAGNVVGTSFQSGSSSTVVHDLAAMGGTGTGVGIYIQGSVTTGASSGDLRLVWSQGTSNATPTVVKAGSTLKVDLIENSYTPPSGNPVAPPLGANVLVTQANNFGNLSYPTGIQSGDLLIAGSYMHRTFSQAITNSVDWSGSGWTEHHHAANAQKFSSRVGYKIADGTETGASPTFSESASGGVKGVWMMRVPQAVLLDTPGPVSKDKATTGTNPNADSPELTTEKLGLVIMVMGDDDRFIDVTTVNNGVEITRRDSDEAQLWIGRAPDGTEGFINYSINMDLPCEMFAHLINVGGIA